jgi:hypothetical protein
MWEVESITRICKSSYGGKVFSNIFISIYVSLMVLGETDMSRLKYKINVLGDLTGLCILPKGLAGGPMTL